MPTADNDLREAAALDPDYRLVKKPDGRVERVRFQVTTGDYKDITWTMSRKRAGLSDEWTGRVEFKVGLGDTLATTVLAVNEDGSRFRWERVIIEPAPGIDDVTAGKALSRYRLAGMLHQLETELRRPVLRQELHRTGLLPGLTEDEAWRDPRLARPKPGAAGYPPEYFADWARRYVEAAEIEPRRTVAYLAEQHPGYTEGTIRTTLGRARKLGLLSKAEAGKAGGRLTKKAKRILGLED